MNHSTTNKTLHLAHGDSLRKQLELTARQSYNPFGGQFKAVFRSSLPTVPIETRSTIYAASLLVVAAASAVAVVVSGTDTGSVPIVALLAIVAAIAERGGLPVSSRMKQSTVQLPILFAAVLFGPLAAMAVGAASMVFEIRGPLARVVAYGSSTALTGLAVGAVATVVLSTGGDGIGGITLATLTGAVAFELVDGVFLGLAAIVRNCPVGRELRISLLSMGALSVAIYSPVVALLVYVYEHVSEWSLPLFLIPALAAQRLYALYLGQRQLAEDLRGVNARLGATNLSFATALVATLEARDEYTAGHSTAVAIYARDIAARLGLSPDDQAKAHLCGLVHDIGKVGLPPGLLQKSGPLTLDERRQMEQHPIIGERILSKVDSYSDIAWIVRHHHERVDGMGYPDRLIGAEIPMISRIIAVADAYDAMTSDRPYRDAMPSQVARMRLARAVGSQFDTSVVAAFEAILASAARDYTRDSALLRQPDAPLVTSHRPNSSVLSGVA